MDGLKIAVVGSGAVGSYYGALLALSGMDVHFLMRRDLEAVRSRGLLIREKEQDLHVSHVKAYSNTHEIGPCDLVLIALKTTANPALEQLLPPLLKEDTLLLTLQNGLGNEEFLAERFGGERVLGGLCFICLNRVQPGVVEHYDKSSLSVGEFGGGPMPRTRKIVEMFERAGVNARLVENLLAERWRKLVWNIPFNGLSIAAGNVTVADIMADPKLEEQAVKLMEEVITVAARLGHSIPKEFMERMLQRSRDMGPYKPSSLIDHMEGRPVEVEAIWGEPLRQAIAVGIECGRLKALYHKLNELMRTRLSQS